MPTEGIAAVQHRIATITARIASFDAPAPTARPLQAPSESPTFAAALERAVDRAGARDPVATWDAMHVGTRGLTPARRAGPTGRLQPPDELAAYGNGRIPGGALTPIGVGSHRLWGPAAEAFSTLRAAAAADGVTIDVTDSYRSHDQQVDVARRKGLYSQGGLAATPGTSNHGWGMALDLDLDRRGQAWMRAHGAEYGFVEAVPREPWHWEYRPAPT